MMTKKFFLYGRFFVSNRNFTTEYVKIVKNSRYFQGFFKISQIPGFLALIVKFQGFPGNPDTFMDKLKIKSLKMCEHKVRWFSLLYITNEIYVKFCAQHTFVNYTQNL